MMSNRIACLVNDFEIGDGFLVSEDLDLRSLMITIAGAVRHL